MKLELNNLLQEIYSWKNLLKNKDEEIENLQKQFLFVLKQNEVLENSRSSLLNEVAELNSAVAALRNSFTKIEMVEADRRNLLEEKQKLKDALESLKKLYHEQNKNVNDELQKIKETNKEETSKLITYIKDEASKQVESLQTELEKKENDIQELKTEIKTILCERNEDLMKIKIQYEDKILKLKQQIPKSKLQTFHGVQMHDIFRQKYLKLEKESEEEISKLKQQIQSLQLLTESLKPKTGSTSLSSVLLKTNKQNVNATTEVSTQTENAFIELSKQFSNQVTDDGDFVRKKICNKTQPLLPQKRKLFNLNQNYYVK